MKRLVMAVMSASAAVALAMPTKDELSKAQPLVAELMAEDVAAYKAKSKKAEEVGDASAKYAKEASTEAAKFLLLKGAISYFVRGEAYDKAADAVNALRTEIADVPPAVVEEIIRKNTARVTAKKAPRLYAMYQTVQVQVAAAKEVRVAQAALAKRPKDEEAIRKLAEAQALSGDWKTALGTFAKLGSKAGAMAKSETEGKNLPTVADFWWDYESYLGEEDADAFKAHAAAIYRKCLADGSIDGLKKNIVEKRLKQVVTAPAPAIETGVSSSARTKPEKMAVKSISLNIIGADPIRLIYCPAGKCEIGFDKGISPFVKHKVTITRPFWMSEAPITVGQYCALMGPYEDRFSPRWMSPSDLKKFTEAMGGDASAVSGLKPREIQQFCQKITESYAEDIPKGCLARLPTDAEWSYALCCGGKVKDADYAAIIRGERPKSPEAIGVNVLKTVERVMKECNVTFDTGKNEDWRKKSHTPRYRVKTCKPNDWGFYDMVGLCWELLADRASIYTDEGSSSDKAKDIFNRQYCQMANSKTPDPIMVNDTDEARHKEARNAIVYCEINDNPCWIKRCDEHPAEDHRIRKWGTGFRLVIGPDLVSEWKAKNAKK